MTSKFIDFLTKDVRLCAQEIAGRQLMDWSAMAARYAATHLAGRRRIARPASRRPLETRMPNEY